VRISVHIERLVLEGLPVTTLQGPQVRGALEKELARLLAANGLSAELLGGIAVPRVRAGTLQLAKENNPAILGRGIARAVYEGIGKPVESAEGRTADAPRAKPGGQR
jgi:hypothetical protein